MPCTVGSLERAFDTVSIRKETCELRAAATAKHNLTEVGPRKSNSLGNRVSVMFGQYQGFIGRETPLL